MILDFRRRIDSGGYGVIFAVEGRAYKLFKAGPEIPPRQTRQGRCRVFECQCEAFERARFDPWLCDHVAKFYGVAVIDDVVDENGESRSADFLLDCCYSMELFSPTDSRDKAYAEWVVQYEYIDKAIRRFDEVGINARDSSVFRYEDPNQFKFIDIEMKDCY